MVKTEDRQANNISKLQYLKNLQIILHNSKATTLEDIKKYIEKVNLKNTTKLSYLNSIIGLNKINNLPVKGNIDMIIEYRNKLNEQLKEDLKNDNCNEKQKTIINKITFKELEDYVKELEKSKGKSINDMQNYLIMALITFYELRNDYRAIKISHLKKDLKKDENIIFIPKKGNALLSLKQYKTAQHEGDKLYEIPLDITKDIKKLIEWDKEREYLFVDKSNKPFNTSTFTHKIYNLTKRKFGIPFSTSTIRKLYLTNKYGDILKNMKEDANIMGHNLITQQAIYIKNTDTNDKNIDKKPKIIRKKKNEEKK